MAINKYKEQLGNINYQDSVAYYRKLKEKFFAEIKIQHSELGGQEISILEENILTAFDKSEVNNARIFNKIQEYFNIFGENIWFNEFGEVQVDIIKLNNEIEKIKKSEKSQEDINKEISILLYQQVDALGSGLQSKIRNLLSTADETSYSVLINRYRWLAKIYLDALRQGKIQTEMVNGKTIHTGELFGKPLITLGGLIKEQLVYDGLKQTLQQANIKYERGGSKAKFNSKETHLDNILSFIDMSDEMFNSQMELTTQVKLPNNEKLLSNIKYYGEQIKSFSLDKLTNTGELLGKRITENATLYGQLIKNGWPNIYDNIKFMRRRSSVLSAFGPETLLFTTNDKRYFMDDFIQDFSKRAKQYLLFAYESKTYAITHTIVIDQPFGRKNAYATIVQY